MKGWVYVIGSFEHFNYVKVGISCDRTPIKGHPSEISRIVEEEVVRFNDGSNGNSLVLAMSQAVSMSLEDADWLASPAVGREML